MLFITKFYSIETVTKNIQGSHCGVMANGLDCNIVVSEFEHLTLFYTQVHFLTNTNEKDMNFYIPQVMG